MFRTPAPYQAPLLLVSLPIAWLFGGCGKSVTLGEIPRGADPSFVLDAGSRPAAEAGLTEYCAATSCPAPFATCPSSQFPCDVNLLNDQHNCGDCDIECPPKVGSAVFACLEGQCRIAACENGYRDCNGLLDDDCEVKLGTNENCNGCGDRCSDPAKPCIFDRSSWTGTCGCASGQVLCEEGCVDPSSSDEHCGACNVACDPAGAGESAPPNAYYGCRGGECGHVKCAAHYADCDGEIHNGCETVLLSVSHCGRCNNACEPGQVCGQTSEGAACLCAKGQTLCLGKCVDIAMDPWNCGACGRICPGQSNGHGASVCDYGACGYSCVSGYGDCNGDPSDGCEVNLSSDPYNCGGCRHACELGQPCIAGRCAVEPCGGGGGVQ